MMMKTLTIAAAVAALTATTALADKVPLGQLSRYLNDMKTAKGAFTQINDDGTISTGTIYIKRPGRIRFEYNPPDNALVLASGGAVVIHDPKTNEPPESYPLNRTPLSIILANNVNLNRAKMVTGHAFDGTSTTGNPVELRQWVINDDAGSQTTVVLGELTKGARMNNSLFNPQSAIPSQSDR